MGFHNTTDNPREYRDEAEVRAVEARDPVRRVERYLEARRCWSEAEAADVPASLAAEVREAMDVASRFPGRNDVFNHVYVDLAGWRSSGMISRVAAGSAEGCEE